MPTKFVIKGFTGFSMQISSNIKAMIDQTV